MRKMIPLCFFLFLLAVPAGAEAVVLDSSGIANREALFDGDLENGHPVDANAALRLDLPEGIAHLYLVFDREYGCITLTTPEGTEAFFDTEGFLHAYVDVESLFGYAPEGLTLCFSDGAARVCEVCAFEYGILPDWVQRWQRIPDGETELLLLSTHGDDEQLFFAGLLPWYGAELGRRVQVVYFTDHRNMTDIRVHEMLNGLWNVGIRDYPVFGSFPDYYTFDVEDARRFYAEQGMPESVLLEFAAEQLRRCRPQVVVGHDLAGEYGHGMHQLTAQLLCAAVDSCADPDFCPESAQRWGTWDVPKTYLHLYPEGEITLDWDIPLDAFDGKTAYQVSRDLGFASHRSQVGNFAWYYRGAASASQVAKFSPCRFGLYRSTVGEDKIGGDFFENLIPEQGVLPEPTVSPLTSAPPEPIRQLPQAEKSWLLLPAMGTTVLLTLTAALGREERQQK